MNKTIIRRKILNLRKKNSNKNFKLDLSQFFSFLDKKKYDFKIIGGYYPSNFEIDDLEILHFFKKRKFIISLPIIRKHNQMDFFNWSTDEPLKINKYGIPEPISSKMLYPDVLLVPLVAYDNNLNRLGYGGGFYDRYIAKIEQSKKILKIGLAFSHQELSRVPTNSHDKKLDFIMTEKGILQ